MTKIVIGIAVAFCLRFFSPPHVSFIIFFLILFPPPSPFFTVLIAFHCSQISLLIGGTETMMGGNGGKWGEFGGGKTDISRVPINLFEVLSNCTVSIKRDFISSSLDIKLEMQLLAPKWCPQLWHQHSKRCTGYVCTNLRSP